MKYITLKIPLFYATHEKWADCVFVDRNIRIDKGEMITNTIKATKNVYYHFEIDRSDTYLDNTNGKFNTRISFPHFTGKQERFCKINYLEYLLLSYINRETTFQKYPIQTIGMGVSIIGLIFNFYFDLSRSSSQNEANQQKIQALEQRILSKNYEEFRERSSLALDSIVK